MSENQHFLSFESLEEAEAFVGFTSLGRRVGHDPSAISVHVRDHRLRAVVPTLELDYAQFSLTQSLMGVEEARRAAYQKPYGRVSLQASVGGRSAVAYELGDEPAPDDPDPRPPAVVTWQDGEIFCFLASDELEAHLLLDLANSLYV